MRKNFRKAHAGWRDTILLLREFRQPLIIFLLVLIGSAWLYYFLEKGTYPRVDSLAKEIYFILTLIFLQASIEGFPQDLRLQAFYFIMPVIGIGLLAQGLTDFGVLLFNRRARSKEWEMAVASTYSNHVVLIGLGHLGYRVVKRLIELNQGVVIVERAPEPDLLHNVRAMGVPVLEEDGTRETVLMNAGIPRARAIILCTQNDILNLRMALKARNLNPKIEVVIRIFDDEFASSLESQFGFHAMSATSMAAPLFAASAAHADISQELTIAGQPHILAHLQISPASRICGMTVNAVEEMFRVSVILRCMNGKREFHPPGDEMIEEGQTIAIFGEPDHIHQLLNEGTR